MRLFLDTNVLVAAFATRGLCADLLSAVLAEAAAGRADAFVSGDRALLAAAADLPFPRLAPRELWERLRAG